ncbi:MAG: ABC transporter substrate-binding protein [Deltaproteobacteria bacterium]|nr:ABC transporter substrate-binding protein [Deltaproteobacteria bacterium]
MLLYSLSLLVPACRAPAPPADTLRVVVDAAPETLDRRYTLSATAQRIASLIAPGLVRIADDGSIAPDLAESFERIGEKRYRFVLREGLRFHDGRPLEAADVVYTYGSLKDPEAGSPLGPKYQAIARVEAIDARTVEIELAEPFAPILLDLTMGIVPRPASGEGPGAREHPIGAGPFRFAGRPDEETIVLEAYEDHHAGRPGVERLVFTVVRDETTRVLAALHGEIDLLPGGVSPILLPRMARSELLEVEQRPGPGYAYLAFNLDHPLLARPEVRRAIAHAIDREALVRFKFKGAAKLADSMLPAGHWAHRASAAPAYDPAKARALLDAAGLPDPDDDGPEVRFRISYKTSTDRFRKSVALVLAAQLEAVGIGVDLQAYEWGTFYGDVKRGRFEIITLKWTPVIEPHLYQWVFHQDSIPSEENEWTGGNRGAYRNPEVDRLIDEAARELDRERRAALYAEVQEHLARDLPYVSLWHEDQLAIVHRRTEGFELSPFGFFTPLAGVSLP